MEENKKVISQSQKKAQKKYDKKTKTISIKYVLKDMKEYERLRSYLDSSGEKLNSFVKMLISDYLTYGKNNTINPIEEKINDRRMYDIYQDIEQDKVQLLINTFGEAVVNKILDEYQSAIEDAIEETIEYKLGESGCAFSEWAEIAVEKEENGEYQGTDKERYRELARDMWYSIGVI